MWLKFILGLVNLASSILKWAERERARAEGRAEVRDEARKVHDERVALAEAARADADDIAAGGVPDRFDRDSADRR